MDERAREDMIIGVAACIEANHCAIKRDDIYKKFKNTKREELKYIIEIMKDRRMLQYDENRDLYRLIIR